MSGDKNQESPFFLDWELAKCIRLATRFQVKNDKKETINSYAYLQVQHKLFPSYSVNLSSLGLLRTISFHTGIFVTNTWIEKY